MIAVVASAPDVCRICAGGELEFRAVPDGAPIVLDRCPHCSVRQAVPYLLLPTRKDRKRASS